MFQMWYLSLHLFSETWGRQSRFREGGWKAETGNVSPSLSPPFPMPMAGFRLLGKLEEVGMRSRDSLG